MAYSESRKNTVLQKYHTKLLHTLSECIEDILPDLESAGAIIGDQRDKVREYVHGKMPANAIDYLLNDHIKAPLSVERSNAFMKLLEVMKKAPTRCSTQCKALAKTVEKELTNEMSSEMDEITRWMQSLGNTGGQVIEGRIRRWKAWLTNTAESGSIYGRNQETAGQLQDVTQWGEFKFYDINGYGNSSTRHQPNDQKNPLIKPFFLAKGPNDELFVRDYATQRLVVFSNDGDRLEYSRYMCGRGNGYGTFQDIIGIAASKDYLYVADSYLDSVQKLKLQNGEWITTIGRSGSGDGEFHSPFGIALDEVNSWLYVCDYYNNRIQVFKNDTFFKSFKGLNSSTAKFTPIDVTLNDNKDQLFVTDFENCRVQVLSTNDGSFIKMFGNDNEFRYPFGIFYAGLGIKDRWSPVILISSAHTTGYDDCVYMVSVNDETSPETLPNSFNRPSGVIMMNDGQIVVANFGSDKLTVV